MVSQLCAGIIRGGCVALLACLAVGGTLVEESGPAVAREYSAYADPEKPVISFLFSQEENVDVFRREFDLEEAEVEQALAAVRAEKETLEKEHAESERIVESNTGLEADAIAGKIDDSDYERRSRPPSHRRSPR